MLKDRLMDKQEAVKILQRSGMVHRNWYYNQYPDVLALEMAPAEHYLKLGAAMGRNPGKNFDTRFYLERYPEVAEADVNPLLHYVLEGKHKGYRPEPEEAPTTAAEREVEELRTKLLSLGFTDHPLRELRKIAEQGAFPSARAMAARELALWHLRMAREADYRKALDYIEAAQRDAPALSFRCKLTIVELLCHHFLGDAEAGEACYERGALAGESLPDTMLVRANLETEPEGRCLWINQVLDRYGLPRLRLSEDATLPPYDRLTAAEPLPPIVEGPKVTVLLAAYNAAETLPTALRSLQEQTWRNLEILVIDDCSTDDGATCATIERFAAVDPRIHLIRMTQNGGAYMARNRGLDVATGEFVTIHDADDWSHPLKIECQVTHLRDHPEVMGCLSQQARARETLHFTRWTGRGSFIIKNVSSFMFRRGPVTKALGYWDSVRFAADSEFIRRIEKVFGKAAVNYLSTGPLSFQRYEETSIVANEVFGMNGFYFGARKEYFDAQQHHHNSGTPLRYNGLPDQRPFPVPHKMRSDRDAVPAERHFHTIFIGDFRNWNQELAELYEEIQGLVVQGRRVGLVEVHDVTLRELKTSMASELRDLVDGRNVTILVYGDDVTCQFIVHVGKAENYDPQRYTARVDRVESSLTL